MFRALFIMPLLVAALLACPFRCLGVVTLGTGDAVASDACQSRCACCAPDTAGLVPGESTQNENDCGCPNCLCDGAIVAADDPLLQLVADDVLDVGFALAAGSGPAILGPTAGELLWAAPPPATGRDLCRRHCVLLI